MNGKVIASLIVLMAVIAGGWMYYLQVYAFYETVAAETMGDVELVSVTSEMPEAILATDVTAIDADSSPIRFRACFVTPMSQALLTESYVLYDDPVPLTAPDWFECFDAQSIGDALADGTALAFTGEENIAYGVDRVVAIFEDGRGYIWHQLNNCGRKAYDGSPLGPECPPRDASESN
ncbi:DUF6446 family protein [Litoreibacter roseus]|uniref:Histidine kinase n=1 Tax=Litoreibacter roseus TaxID=2601869 RepID=A0A6N6JL91_9RHOB|nr:DUF6446 family protein [Litoreibacter roseus]GFE65952.1 hypothetical protein KIN_30260 [Litoreibacter roseus]